MTAAARLSKVPASTLRAGDVIMPPARELRLWLRRTLAERGLPASALHITVTQVEVSHTDKGGQWLTIRGTSELGGVWRMAARPSTPWPVVRTAGKVSA